MVGTDKLRAIHEVPFKMVFWARVRVVVVNPETVVTARVSVEFSVMTKTDELIAS
jgi:hypothetical protein